MEYRMLGKTGIDVSVIAMGCWALAGDEAWGPQDESDSIATVHAALDVGVNLFDTAEGYGDGRSEEVLGKALVGRRDRAIIATKVSGNHLSAEGVVLACERSLKLLRTDTIDLYQIHWPSRQIPLAETLRALQRLREQGKIRAIGVCNFGLLDLKDLVDLGGAESNQLPYSLLWRGIEHELQPRCQDVGMGILCYSPLAQGLLTGKFASPEDVPAGRARTRHFSKDRPLARHGEDGCEAETFAAIDEIRRICQRVGAPMAQAALAWLVAQDGVASVLAGARRPEQIEDNVRAAELDLPSEVIDALSAATARLKEALGANLDQYQGAATSRFR
ncbi:MAG: aldo/keto reductase [Chloroflexi bacterium]|nr:aldo/keto reductase [Chloroflexota bacterium]